MSRAARLGAFIVATLAILVARYLHHRRQAVSFQLNVPTESAIRQRGGPGCWRRCAGGRRSQRNSAQHRVASQARRKSHGRHGSRQIDARDHQARLCGHDRNGGFVGQPVSGDLVWIGWIGRRAGWRYYREPAAARNGRPSQKDKRHSGWQPASHPECHPGNGESRLDQRQD